MTKTLKFVGFTVILAFLLNFLPSGLFKEEVHAIDSEETEPIELVEEYLFHTSNLVQTERLVHVRLSNYLGNKKTVPITVNGNYKVAEDTKITLQPNQNYHITMNSSGALQLFHNTTLLKSFTTLTLVPDTYDEAHYLFVENRAYLGNMFFEVRDQFIRPINTLPLEDYLKGVVPREMPASWSLEALKAQALAARSYAVRRGTNIILDTQANQVYGGYKLRNGNNVENLWNSRSTQAVNDTRGEVVLTSTNAIAETVYSSSNGGFVESNSGAWGTAQLNYLQAKADPFDPKNKSILSINQQQLQPGDLRTPWAWWSTTTEANTSIANRIKTNLLATQQAADVKISAINAITLSNKTTGERYRNASFNVSFYQKDKPLFDVVELQGRTRWITNQEITQYGWKEKQQVVIIGRGDQSADALTGNVLAAKYNAPILLTQNQKFPDQMVEELTRLQPSKIYLLGGQLAISDTVEKKIKELAPKAEIIRIAGSNRYITSIDIAKEVNSASKSIILAPAYDGSGDKESPDALTVGPYAGINQVPIILTEKNRLRKEIKNYIVENGITQVYLLGGSLVVSEEVEKELEKLVAVERISGGTRYETATKISERFPLNNTNVFFARGDDHTDALAAAPLATKMQAPILLTRTTAVPDVVSTWLIEKKPTISKVFFLGGQLAIEDKTRNVIKDTLVYRLDTTGALQLFNQEVTITSTTSEGLRTLFGMRSSLTSSDKAKLVDGTLTFEVLGFGHGVGMSQFGANERAKAGHTYKDILKFYYPNTTIGIR
ncbi:SpoIID/LytB domain-containing protein [Anaerobacillus sp. CMMVII]|uniref:SpoIID/LytB domain-containing protein n=1 Tax=Anaerobacillus sp. CMMVII TaxID=2755588 RepID=UPI0021B74B54|nr:SpoIID/LytB domain-containing protein [Anaerobacillus sp. CMMVII]MCT8140326.1 SpoIID/LytB domain-containing protein [Anaerobacillus sp. CMMVII]